MRSAGVSRKKGVSIQLFVGFLVGAGLMLTTISAVYLGGQGLGALALAVGLILILVRILFIALNFAPLILALISIYFGYTLLIKKKQQSTSTQRVEEETRSKNESG